MPSISLSQFIRETGVQLTSVTSVDNNPNMAASDKDNMSHYVVHLRRDYNEYSGIGASIYYSIGSALTVDDVNLLNIMTSLIYDANTAENFPTLDAFCSEYGYTCDPEARKVFDAILSNTQKLRNLLGDKYALIGEIDWDLDDDDDELVMAGSKIELDEDDDDDDDEDDHEGQFYCPCCEEWHDNIDQAGECIDCGEVICEDCADRDDNDNILCDDCRDNHDWSKCDCCGLWYSDDDLTRVSGYNDVCDDCLDEYYFYCNCCNEWCSNDDQAGECIDCGEVVCTSCSNRDSQDNVLCDHCRDRGDWYRCHDCGCWVEGDWSYYDEDSDETYCERCWDRRPAPSSINRYDYKPTPRFYSCAADFIASELAKMYIGVELEVDEGNDAEELAEIIGDNYSEVYCKHDGSLRRGLEIVSHPCSYEYHRDRLDWQGIISDCREHDFTSHNAGTCGLHLHLSREGFGENESTREMNIAKLLYLFERHWEKILKFSRRTKAQADEWASRYCSDEYIDPPAELLNKARGQGRYKAVNLCNYNTVELRIFRGTLKYSTFLATLQFTRVLVETVKNLTIAEIQGLTWNELLARGEEYEELMAYCSDRGLLAAAQEPVSIPEIMDSHGNLLPRPLPTVEEIENVLVQRYDYYDCCRWQYTEPVRQDMQDALINVINDRAYSDRVDLARAILDEMICSDVRDEDVPMYNPPAPPRPMFVGYNILSDEACEVMNQYAGHTFVDQDRIMPTTFSDRIAEGESQSYINGVFDRWAGHLRVNNFYDNRCDFAPPTPQVIQTESITVPMFDALNVLSAKACEAMNHWLRIPNDGSGRPVIQPITPTWRPRNTYTDHDEYDEVMDRWAPILREHYGIHDNREGLRRAQEQVIYREDGRLSDAAVRIIVDWGQSIGGSQRFDYYRNYYNHNTVEENIGAARTFANEIERAGLRDNSAEIMARQAAETIVREHEERERVVFDPDGRRSDDFIRAIVDHWATRPQLERTFDTLRALYDDPVTRRRDAELLVTIWRSEIAAAGLRDNTEEVFAAPEMASGTIEERSNVQCA